MIVYLISLKISDLREILASVKHCYGFETRHTIVTSYSNCSFRIFNFKCTLKLEKIDQRIPSQIKLLTILSDIKSLASETFF